MSTPEVPQRAAARWGTWQHARGIPEPLAFTQNLERARENWRSLLRTGRVNWDGPNTVRSVSQRMTGELMLSLADLLLINDVLEGRGAVRLFPSVLYRTYFGGESAHKCLEIYGDLLRFTEIYLKAALKD